MKSILLAGLFIGTFGPGALASELPKTQNGVLVDQAGRTLYTFDKDAGGKSACNGGCAASWPALAAASDASASGEFSVLLRDDGSRQWTFQGRPLYLYAADEKPGDISGDNLGGVWHVVRAATNAGTAKPLSAGTAPTRTYRDSY
jgi:predicted lipoprotein with Yx(FWY)xxD motif